MPLFDHFRPPVEFDLPWEVLLGAWGPAIAKTLNERWLSRDFVAFSHCRIGPQVEIDVSEHSGQGGAKASMPATFPDRFEVRVVTTSRGRRLVGAVELVSPRNKDRPDARQAFVAKCASYLHEGVSVVIIDVVTDRHANLHNDLLTWFHGPSSCLLPQESRLYAAAYRPVLRGEQAEIDVWVEGCTVGADLPTMPLRLTGDLFVPIEFETTYLDVCRTYRLV